jgi:hypothetical protein
MPLVEDACELWDFCKAFRPTILTGLPRGSWAGPQKRRWVAKQLGGHVPVITCMARDKCVYASPGAVLVDDTVKYAELWRERGGVFVEHRSASESIAALRQLGFRAAGGDGDVNQT